MGQHTDTDCQVIGLSNVYVIDGSWLPRISEKPQTFTLVANAMRVADVVTEKIATNGSPPTVDIKSK